MSYYRIMAWQNRSITKMLKENNVHFFVGDDTECHLNIPDNQLKYKLDVLMEKFDVMFIERCGSKCIWLDIKNGLFNDTQRS